MSHESKLSQLQPEQIKHLAETFPPLQRTASSMTQMAEALTNHIYRSFRDSESGRNQIILVRVFRTCPNNALSPRLRAKLPPEVPESSRVLALMASRGENQNWNYPFKSAAHQVIPLDYGNVAEAAPLLATLMKTLGISLPNVPDNPDLTIEPLSPLKLLYVPDAEASPLIPEKAQFIRAYAVGSVVGFGGPLSDIDHFAVVIFFRGFVDIETARSFTDWAVLVSRLLRPFELEKK